MVTGRRKLIGICVVTLEASSLKMIEKVYETMTHIYSPKIYEFFDFFGWWSDAGETVDTLLGVLLSGIVFTGIV